MKIPYTALFLLFVANLALSQEDYFQQKVNYEIKAELNDSAHLLSAQQKVSYINNSSDHLAEIYFHLWANAYRDQSTAFAEQQLRLHNTDFYFSDASERGGYELINFVASGQQLVVREYNSQADIVIVELPSALAPGDSVEIFIDFELRIPKSFSRFGRTEGSYQLVQWYPKPAVYDIEGWHPMPYLDQGEFYSEFGNFNVQITLPKKYIVSATGTLQNEEERNFLLSKADEIESIKDVARLKEKMRDTTKNSPVTGSKTLQYRARDVHDFALFADVNFEVQHKKAAIPGREDSIDVWAFFTPKQASMWLEALTYLERSVQFYSKELGTYPYPQVTAVEGALSAGAGMEYPMITIIPRAANDRLLDNVITHEVGHNWWYGILASNERKDPWLDEGVNSFYEELYMEKYYPEKTTTLNELIESRSNKEGRWVWEEQAQKHRDQAPGLPADEFSGINYYLGAYWKPAQSFLYLSEYVGRSKLRRAMQDFYKKYKFRHCGPQHLKDHLEVALDEDLSWLFEGLINSNREVNYKIISLKKDRNRWRLKVRNTGKVEAPLSVGGYAGDTIFTDRWLSGFSGTKEITLLDREGLESIQINVNEHLPEHKLGDNLKRIEGDKIKWKPIKPVFIAGLHKPHERNIFITPALGYNAYDGIQIGMWLHNVGIPSKSFEFSLLPTLGVASNSFAGMGNARYRHFFNTTAGGIHHIDVGLGFRNYSYNDSEDYDFYDRYIKVAPYLSMHFKSPPLSYLSHYVQFRSVYIQQNYHLGINIIEGIYSDEFRDYWAHELSYNFKYDHPIQPMKGKAQVEYIEGVWRYTANYQQNYQYQKGKYITFSMFAGGMSNYDESPTDTRLYGTGHTGFGHFHTDYKYDHLLVGRSKRNGIWSRQIFTRDASLKTLANNVFSSTFMASLGVRADLPIPIVPLRPYFDIAIFDRGGQTTTAFSSGIAISVFRETLEIYFPLYESQNILNSQFYNLNPGYFQRISFSLNLRQWGVFNIKEQLNLF